MLTFISKFLRTEKRKKDDGRERGRGDLWGGVGCLFIRRKSGPRWEQMR